MTNVSIAEILRVQAPTDDGWICPNCENHEGNLHCRANVFISVVGANMKNCIYFREKRSERTCT